MVALSPPEEALAHPPANKFAPSLNMARLAEIEQDLGILDKKKKKKFPKDELDALAAEVKALERRILEGSNEEQNNLKEEETGKKVKSNIFSNYAAEQARQRVKAVLAALHKQRPRNKFRFTKELETLGALMGCDLTEGGSQKEDASLTTVGAASTLQKATASTAVSSSGGPVGSSSQSAEAEKKKPVFTLPEVKSLLIENEKNFTKETLDAEGDIELLNLENAFLTLGGQVGALHVRRLKNCVVHVRTPIAASCLLHDCENVVFIFEQLQQLRIHTSKQLVFYVSIRS